MVPHPMSTYLYFTTSFGFCKALRSGTSVIFYVLTLLWIVNQSFRLYSVRQKFYELLVNCIPPESILKVIMLLALLLTLIFSMPFNVSASWTCFLLLQKLLTELMKKLDSDLKHEVCHWAAHYVSNHYANIFSTWHWQFSSMFSPLLSRLTIDFECFISACFTSHYFDAPVLPFLPLLHFQYRDKSAC